MQRAAFSPLREKLAAWITEGIALGKEVDDKLVTTGPANLTEILFPMKAEASPHYQKLDLRNQFVSMFTAGLKAGRMTAEYDPAKEFAA